MLPMSEHLEPERTEPFVKEPLVIKSLGDNNLAESLDTEDIEIDLLLEGIYQKYGYELYGQLDDFPPGHTRYYLKKRLRE